MRSRPALRPLVRTIVAPLVAIAIAVSIGSWASGHAPDTRSSLTAALDALPAATLVAGFTDWSAIRSDLDLGSTASAATRSALADDASLRDLTTRSVLGGVIADMQAAYGWSAADLDWESYGQSADGAAMVARFSDSVSINEVEDRLDELGYQRTGEVWNLGESASTVTPQLAATLGHLSFVPRLRLVIAADRAGYVPTVLATIRGAHASALSNRPIADVAAALAGSDTVLIQSGPFACRATSLDDAGADVQAQAAAAIDRAGALATPIYVGRGLVDGPRTQMIRFAAAFASPAQASGQARVRRALTSGPFIGRSGQVEDILDLQDVSARRSVTTLRFAVDPAEAAFMSGEGPALFAGCPA